jgi:hypothetical protein
VTDVEGLVGLLQRADWTRLSLSAETNDGSTVLVAPGMRYRYQTAGYMTGCDGARPWELSEDEDDHDGSVHWISGPNAPLPRMLCPAWLLKSSRLEVRGRTRACGRDALDVVMTRRPTLRTRPMYAHHLAEHVEALIDAESGIVLRLTETDDGSEPAVLELIRADFAPVIDSSLFQPPPGSRIAEGFGESVRGALGPAGQAAATVGGLAAGALGAWIKYSPWRRPRTPDAHEGIVETAIPLDEPTPDGSQARPPLSDRVLELLHAGGPAELAASLHQWTDVGAMAAAVPSSARRAGLGGLGLLMDAISEQPTTRHTVSAIRFAGPRSYQIDHSYTPRGGPLTIACDGQHRWEVYPDKIITEPAGPPPHDIGNLLDPSWLLQCALSGGDIVTACGRPAYQIMVTRRKGEDSVELLFRAAVADVDAELGIVSRLTYYVGKQPVQRYELRDATTRVGDFLPRVPAGLPVTERTRRFEAS